MHRSRVLRCNIYICTEISSVLSAERNGWALAMRACGTKTKDVDWHLRGAKTAAKTASVAVHQSKPRVKDRATEVTYRHHQV